MGDSNERERRWCEGRWRGYQACEGVCPPFLSGGGAGEATATGIDNSLRHIAGSEDGSPAEPSETPAVLTVRYRGEEWKSEVYPEAQPGTREYIVQAVLLAFDSVVTASGHDEDRP